MSTVLDFKDSFQCSDTHTFVLAVSHHVSEKEAEPGRMVEGYLCPKKQKTCQNKNDGIRMELKDFLGPQKKFLHLSMTL